MLVHHLRRWLKIKPTADKDLWTCSIHHSPDKDETYLNEMNRALGHLCAHMGLG